jgi:hypothetical protein
VLSPVHDRSAAYVSLYGFDYRIELGPAGMLPTPTVIICCIDGSEMYIGSEEELSTAIRRIEAQTFSRPWLQQD